MSYQNKVIWVSLFSLILSLVVVSGANAKSEYNWANYFSFKEAKSIKKMVKKSIRNEFKNPDKKWRNIIGGKLIDEESIDYSKININGSIKISDLASNGCTAGQVLKYDGASWACSADDDSGSVLGNSIESSEIADGTIVNEDINASAAIDYSKLNLGANISSANITNGTIVNEDINVSAAIDYSKLNLAGGILTSDLASNGCTAGQVLKYDGASWACSADDDSGSVLGNSIESSEITDGTIVDADISSSAAIDSDKINFLDNSIDFGSGNINLTESSSVDHGEIKFNESGTSEYSYIRKHQPSGYLQIGSTDDDPIAISETVFISSGKNLHVGGDINFSDAGRSITFSSGVDGSIAGEELLPSAGRGVVTIKDALRLEPISNPSDVCNATTEGIIYYSSTDHVLKLCNGTAWVNISTAP